MDGLKALRERREEILAAGVIRKGGFLVFDGEPTGDLCSLVENDRRARDQKNLARSESPPP